MSSGEGKSTSPRVVCWVMLVCSVLAIIPVRKHIDAARGLYGPIEDVLYMPSGRIIGQLSLGHEGLLADIYWTRVVQYFGRKRIDKDVRLDLLGSLLRISTELDPHLLIAYRFGAIFLASKPPEGAGQPLQAIELLRHGIVANPNYWRFWQDIGFIYYWDLKDYPKAVKAFAVGSQQPGALYWMKAIAAMIAAKGGDTKTSVLLWTQVYQSAENDQMRENALEHLAAFKAQEDIETLDKLLQRFRETQGRPAHSMQELVAAGLLKGVPADPTGIPYVVGRNGAAALGSHSKVNLRLIL